MTLRAAKTTRTRINLARKTGVQSNFAKIPLDSIGPCPFRLRDSDVDPEFLQSVKTLGLIEPPTVRIKQGDPVVRYEVVTGSRRIEAARQLGEKEIECKLGAWNDHRSDRYKLVCDATHRVYVTTQS